MISTFTRSWARFDVDRHYRYELGRTWEPSLPSITWCMLNPSTADEHDLDPTLRKCLGYSVKWGYGEMRVVNLFAWRSTDPKALAKVAGYSPVGPENNTTILAALATSQTFLVGWGSEKIARSQACAILRLMKDRKATLHHLGQNRDGHPKHPLYLPGDLRPMAITPAGLIHAIEGART
jgi:hypothetical protein